jgi:hypothetical protein
MKKIVSTLLIIGVIAVCLGTGAAQAEQLASKYGPYMVSPSQGVNRYFFTDINGIAWLLVFTNQPQTGQSKPEYIKLNGNVPLDRHTQLLLNTAAAGNLKNISYVLMYCNSEISPQQGNGNAHTYDVASGNCSIWTIAMNGQ